MRNPFKSKSKISSPLSVRQNTHYEKVRGADYSALPRSITFNGPQSPVLNRINELLRCNADSNPDGWDKLALLGDLFLTTDYALKKANKGQQPQFTANKDKIERLFLAVVNRLCLMHHCQVNQIPQVLEDYWGRVLTPHGHKVDTQQVATGAQPTVAQYLSRAAVEKFRLRFYPDGKLYMRDRNQLNNTANQAPNWVLANSAGIGWEDARGQTAPAMMYPGYAGFALSMGREFYMAHHRGCFRKDNFFHSSYLAGDSVLCTGTLQIINGIVRGVANDSGHYQPSLMHLRNVAETLKMQGCDLSGIRFDAIWESLSEPMKATFRQFFPGYRYNYNGGKWCFMSGDFLLNQIAAGPGLYARYQANMENIRRRKN